MTGQNGKLGKLKNGNPAAPIETAQSAPRCGARCKRTVKPCKAPAMANGRCRLHGGKSTGPRTPEGLQRIKEAKTIHGYYAGPNNIFGSQPGPYWKGGAQERKQLERDLKALGIKRRYYRTTPAPVRPKDATGRFRRPYSNEEITSFSPITRDPI